MYDDGWNHNFDLDFYYVSFYLNNQELAYIEEGLNFDTGNKFYFGFCKSKSNQHFHLEDDSLEIMKFKVMLKLKEFGWDIENWAIGGEE